LNWWVVVVLIVLVLAVPPYAFFVFKFAGAGWLAGVRAYIRHRGVNR
jgi:hypothetical protein